MPGSRHVASLTAGEDLFESDLGRITRLSATSFPILSGMSLKRIVLEPGAIREPQWNVNANQLAYVVAGRVLVSTLGPVLANATSLALSPHPAMAGTAASLQGVLQYLVSGAVASAMALVAHDQRSAAIAMGVAIAASALAALLVFALLRPVRAAGPVVRAEVLEPA